jgi:pimeloyl-ACP methyl ester carboxylesterase
MSTATRAGPASGDFSGRVEMNGRKVQLECAGTGSPTVILISGYRNDGEIWTTPPGPGIAPVFAAVAGFTHVCAYNRPGTILDATPLSRSDPVPMPRTADDLLPDARQTIATESDHYIQLEQPDLVIDAVRQVVEGVRDPGTWRQPKDK